MTEKAKNSILKVAAIAGCRTDKYLQQEILADAFHNRKESDTTSKLRNVQKNLDCALSILHAMKTE